MSTLIQAMTLGSAAQRAGMQCAPALDLEVMSLYMTAPDNIKTDVLKAWTHGWHMANLKEITR